MNRDRNGRFIKNNQLEITIPSPMAICKIIIVMLFLLPWIHIIFIRFDILNFVDRLLIYLMGPKETCENMEPNGKTPY